MDLQVVPSGRCFYQIPSDLAALLLEAFPERFMRLGDTSQHVIPWVPPVDQWFVYRDPQTNELAIRAKLTTGENLSFFGEPSGPRWEYIQSRGCPQAVLDEYRSIKLTVPMDSLEATTLKEDARQREAAKQKQQEGSIAAYLGKLGAR